MSDCCKTEKDKEKKCKVIEVVVTPPVPPPTVNCCTISGDDVLSNLFIGTTAPSGIAISVTDATPAVVSACKIDDNNYLVGLDGSFVITFGALTAPYSCIKGFLSLLDNSIVECGDFVPNQLTVSRASLTGFSFDNPTDIDQCITVAGTQEIPPGSATNIRFVVSSTTPIVNQEISVCTSFSYVWIATSA